MATRTVGDLLVAKGVINDAVLRSAREKERREKKDIEVALIDSGVTEQDVLEAKSEMLGIPSRSLRGTKVGFDILKYIPEESSRHYKIVPLAFEEGVLEIGMVSPEDIEAREALQFISSNLNVPFKIFLISRSDFNKVLKDYRGLGGEINKALGELESALRDEAIDLSEASADEKSLSNLTEEAPITKIVAVVLKHAVEGRASDIHIEPSRDQMRVRFRVDGILYTSLFLPMSVHDAVVSRIKIMTNMKIDEKRKPQDGRFRATIDRREIDFRVSTFPTYFGEKVEMRILDPNIGIKTLEELGVDGRNLEILLKALKRPFGMILLTGPTGSGKSTTLYSMLKILNDEKRNIVSLEEPIEYYVEGVNQSQIRPEIGYTFAAGLRHVLRQDPDIIMVGEIRDKETAQLAVHASLTGHLVLSTLHTNNAVGVIPRLADMGIDPFLIPSTLAIAMSQRLTRTLCKESKKAISVTAKLKERLEKEIAMMPEPVRKDITLPEEIYEALPSGGCPKGTRGRIAVFEVLSMTPELEQIVLSDHSEAKITQEAHRQNMLTMRQDGIIKALRGKIGLEELFEVVV